MKVLNVTPREATLIQEKGREFEVAPGIYAEQEFCGWMKERFGTVPGEYRLVIHFAPPDGLPESIPRLGEEAS